MIPCMAEMEMIVLKAAWAMMYSMVKMEMTQFMEIWVMTLFMAEKGMI